MILIRYNITILSSSIAYDTFFNTEYYELGSPFLVFHDQRIPTLIAMTFEVGTYNYRCAST